MRIHREGYKSILISAVVFAIINLLSFYFISFYIPWLSWVIFFLTLGLLLFMISFFRVPARTLTTGDDIVLAPADGKVVVIEETTDEEYFHDRRLQISIFMSPANVHQNRNPVSGEVIYSKHQRGKFLVAWHPKSSTLNERHAVVIKHGSIEVMVKQIAGALAKRISNYLVIGQKVDRGAEMGFIKFGSRVDVLLPVGTEVSVQLNQVVRGGVTVIARLPK